MSQGCQYVRHVGYDRIGRVVNVHERGDVEVVAALNTVTGKYYVTQCTWFKENIEPSTYEAWLARDRRYHRR